MKTLKYSKDETLKRERIKRYKLLIREYELIKRKEHSTFRFVNDWAKARSLNKKIFLKFYNRYLKSENGKELLPQTRGPKPCLLKAVNDTVLQEKVFSILHTPPNLFGYNRTTWRLVDIKDIMNSMGHQISKTDISRITKNAGFRYVKAKVSLTSNDPKYREKLRNITYILANLKNDEKFFSIDEFGPFSVKMKGGTSLMPKGTFRSIEQSQKSKGVLILTAALELSSNQITHFFSSQKNTEEIIKLMEVLHDKYKDQQCLYSSWDAASWHVSKDLFKRMEELNSKNAYPTIKVAPLPSSAQFLNVIESVFSGMAKAIIHNSNYPSIQECKRAVDVYFQERNHYYHNNKVRAGKKIWGKEIVEPNFCESNNCKEPQYCR